MITIF